MPYIDTKNDLPGITGLMLYRPETGLPLRAFAQALLRGPSPLSPVERELIAVAVSRDNACVFCATSHAAACDALAGHNGYVESVLGTAPGMPVLATPSPDAATTPMTTPELSARMQALIAIAHAVARSGRAVTDDDIARARAAGATDVELHDAVLVAAAFCMFNRYVDGLRSTTPTDPRAYDAMGQRLATQGYGPQPGLTAPQG